MTPLALIIAEKPQAARRIAEALGGTRRSMHRLYGVVYWEFPCRLGVCIVAPSVGHIFGLDAPPGPPPVFRYEWKPLWQVDRAALYTKKYYAALRSLCRKASLYINACDYDIEGSLIGFMIIRMFGDVSRARRMKFSTLTRRDIVKAFNNLESLDYPMIEAGRARHILDWLWGINSSRLLMEAVKRVTGRRMILSAGRVQSPTLLEAVTRDLASRLHVPLPSFRVKVTARLPSGREIRLTLSPSLDSRRKAVELAAEIRRKGRLIVSRVEASAKRLSPPPPFNLGDLQAEAARIYGMSPYRVQRVAEQLYLDALISYPRTDSQVIPPTVDVHGIVRGLAAQLRYRGLVEELLKETGGVLKPRRGLKTDPAHPAIHPTGLAPERRLQREELLIYDLVVRRFLASMAPAALLEETRVVIEAPGGLRATLTGVLVRREGWFKYYKFLRPEERVVSPELSRRGVVLRVVGVSVAVEYT